MPPIVHSEGITERIGDIVLQCTGAPNMPVVTTLTVFLPVSITNRIDANSFSTDVSLTIDSGSGPMPSGVSGMVTNQSITFNNLNFKLSASGTATLRLTDVRADVNQLGLMQTAMPIEANLSSTLPLANNPVIVAYSQQGLLATISSSGVRCAGSPVPTTISLTNLLKTGTVVESTRVTEGFADSFQPKDPTSDTGTRIIITYSNFPSTASILVPDAVAGSNATVPTAGGDLGAAAAVGEYTPGQSTLLLVRVLGADQNGAGGTLATLPAPNATGVLVLDGANPVSLAGGTGYAVYEVVDANPTTRETGQIPSFYGIQPNTSPVVTSQTVMLAPISTVTTASTNAPIPRFAAVQPPSDCTLLNDCNATYFPVLQISATPLQATAVAGGKRVTAGFITIRNSHAGTLDWQGNITYTNGSGWLILSEPFGINGGNVQVVVDPSQLTPGTYQATVTIDGGPMAGSQAFPVTVTVNPATAKTSIGITAVTDAADFHAGPVVAGSLVTIFGTNLAGQNVAVTFDNIAAQLLYAGAQQINLRVPSQLAGHTSTQLIVTVDGSSSAPFTVPLTQVAPAVFTPGVLNQNNTVNSAAKSAPAGTVLQIFGTGMPDSGGSVTVQIQNHANLVPLYAGSAPGLPGVQQVNVAIPAGMPAMTTTLIICVANGNEHSCSQPETIYIQ